MKYKPNNRPVPPAWKFKIETDFHRQFTTKERLKILLGFNANIRMAIATEHHCGRMTPAMVLELTPAVKPRPSFLSRLFNRKPKAL